MSEFFEFKYLAIDCYYHFYFELDCTHTQAADRCIYEFKKSMSENIVREIAVYSTVLSQFTIRETEIEVLKSKYNHLMKLCNSVFLSELFNENELKYLEDELSILKEKFENL